MSDQDGKVEVNELAEVARARAVTPVPGLAEPAQAAFGGFRAERTCAPKTPTPWSYWATADKKILAGAYPGDLNKTIAAVKLTQLVDAGVKKFVDLTEDGELRLYDDLLVAFFPKVEYIRVPIRDVTAADTSQMMAALRAVVPPADGITYVHCRGGCGRTGQVLGCYMIEQGMEPAAALAQVQSLTRPLWESRHEDCPQTSAQKQVILNWRQGGRA